MWKDFKSPRVAVLCVVVVLTSVFVNPMMAGKGGSKGNDKNNLPPADVEFRDAIDDTIQSDGMGIYMDGVSGIQASTESNAGYSLNLVTPSEGSERGVVLNTSMLVASPDSTPPGELPDGFGTLGFFYTSPKVLPEAGETINADIGVVVATFLNPEAPAGVTIVFISILSATITANDADTFVWEVDPTDIIEIDELTQKYRGKKLAHDESIRHGTYTNCSFAITFTRLP